MKKFYYCRGCAARFEAEETLFEGASAVCPACGKTRPIREFAEINFCPHCRSEVTLGLNTAPGEQVRCPACGEEFRTAGTAAKLPAREGDLPPTLEAGDFFDKYRIERLLGRGGMGEVYLARHRLMDRVCALKILTVGGDPGAAARFVQEAKLANRISHPNIISVFDVGTELNTGRLFIAMEYVDGTSLSSLMQHRRFSEKELLLIGIGVCEALTAMEQYGVVHRDIKPANIMITRSGGIKLADLGIAKAGDRQYGDITLTRGTEVFGTPQYASPEQCRSAHSADHRSDIYSLGATLYHLAGGEPPYSGESSLAIVLKVLKEDPPPLWDRNTALSPELAALIESMMRRDPALRPQHAEEVLARMKDILRTASDRIPVAVSAKPAARRRKSKPQTAVTPAPADAEGYSRQRILLGALILLTLILLLIRSPLLEDTYQNVLLPKSAALLAKLPGIETLSEWISSRRIAIETRRKLDRIILPSLTIEKASIRVAASQLTSCSFAAAPRDGVYFAAGENIGEDRMGQENINLHLNNVPLGEAVRRICKDYGFTFTIDSFGIVTFEDPARSRRVRK